MSVNNRFNHIINSLFAGNKSAFASAIGVTPSVVDNIVGRRQGKPSFEVVEKVSTLAEVNIEWLITGHGDMLKQSAEPTVRNTSDKLISTDKSTERISQTLTQVSKNSPGAIPLVSEKAVGGFASEHFSIKEKDVLDYYVIPKFQSMGVDFMIEVIGDSMIPRLYPGDVIACSVIHNSRFIQWNKPHLIATREQGLIVKRIRKSEDKNCLLAVSDNKEYDPFDIPKDEIMGIARIVGVLHLE